LVLANDCEPTDLDAVQATDTVIRKDAMARNSFITDMMPEHFPFVISHFTFFIRLFVCVTSWIDLRFPARQTIHEITRIRTKQ